MSSLPLHPFRLAAIVLMLAGLAACGGNPEPTMPASSTPQIEATPTQAPSGTPPPTTTPDLPAMLPVPTVIPPAAESRPTPLPTVSALARIRSEGNVRAGVLYNNPPMSSLSERGEVIGYAADLARAVAADWGVEVEFVQVTRQNALAMMLAGEVDVLVGIFPHTLEGEEVAGFSQTYFPSGQYFLVKEDGGLPDIASLNGRRVGVVQGTASEWSLGQALSTGVLTATPLLYLTLDLAVGALGSGEVDAVLSEEVQLVRLRDRLAGLSILPEPLEAQPYAFVFQRHDDALRYLLDRSLQRLASNGTLDEFRRTWLPSVMAEIPIPVWPGVMEDERTLESFDTALVYEPSPVLTRIRNGESIRVAGLELSDQLTGLNARLETFYQALVQEMASRWGVPVEFIPASAANGVELVATGQADLAVGVTPRWTGPYEVAYTAPLVLHGDRLMVPFNSRIEGYADLRGGRWVGIFASEPGSATQVNELASSVNAMVNIYTIINDGDAVYSMLVDKNIDVVFGDSLRLIPLAEANADLVRLTDRWYTHEYFSIGVPRRDADFWSLVEVTLQDIAADGVFATLWDTLVASGAPVQFERWPGGDDLFLGVSVGNSD